MFEIIRIRESHANKALKDKIEVYIKECDRLQRKLSMYERFAVQIADAVETLDVQGNL